jgi:hypothetical protein
MICAYIARMIYVFLNNLSPHNMGLFSFGKKEASTPMNWHKLETADNLEEAIEKSNAVPVLLFKHSTRCSISSMALHSLQQSWRDAEGKIEPYFFRFDRTSHCFQPHRRANKCSASIPAGDCVA